MKRGTLLKKGYIAKRGKQGGTRLKRGNIVKKGHTAKKDGTLQIMLLTPYHNDQESHPLQGGHLVQDAVSYRPMKLDAISSGNVRNNSIHDVRKLSGTPGLRLLSVPRWSDLIETAQLSLIKRVAPASLMIPNQRLTCGYDVHIQLYNWSFL